MAHGRAGEQLERLVVLDLAVAQDAAVAVARVLAEADVGDERQAGHLGAQRPQRPLHDPVVLPGARALLVLLLRDPEEEHGPHAERRELGRLAHDLVDRALRDPVEAGDGTDDALAGTGEERHHDVVEREARLAHERAQRVRAPQAPQPGDGEAAHRGKGTSAGLPRGSSSSSSTRRRAVVVPGVEPQPLREELPDRPRGGHRRQRQQHAGDAVQLAAGEQAEDDEQRMEAERVGHHVRHDDVALDLVDEDEEREHPERRDGSTTSA